MSYTFPRCGIITHARFGKNQKPDFVAVVSGDDDVLGDAGGGSSTFAARALLTTEPPSIDAGEITDKGYINQRAVLERRAAIVERLYQNPPGDDVIVLEDLTRV